MVMWRPFHASGHSNWNHWPADVYYPQPHNTEASDVNVADHHARFHPVIMLTPFHPCRNVTHHCKSEWNAMHLKNVLSGLTMLDAGWSSPIRDCRFLCA